MVCLIDEDVGESQYAPISLRLPGWEYTSKYNYYQFNNTGAVHQVKCRQSNGGSPRKSLKQLSQIAYMVKVVSSFIKQSV